MVVANAGNRDAVAAGARGARRSASTSRSTTRTDDIALIAVQGPAAQAIVEATAGHRRHPLAARRAEVLPHDARRVPAPAPRPCRCTSAAPATPARTASSSTSRADVGRRAVGRAARRRRAARPRPGGPRRPRHAAPRGRACRSTATSSRATSCPPRPGSAASSPPTRTTSSAAPALGRRRRPTRPVLVGLVSEGKRAGRAGYAVLRRRRHAVGEITSGALSPTLGHPIAMAFVSPRVSEPGTELDHRRAGDPHPRDRDRAAFLPRAQ